MENANGQEGNKPGLPLRWNLRPNELASARVRDAFRIGRRRHSYSLADKERAIQLLDLGVPCRQVALLMSPVCCCGTPVRWRQAARRREREHLAGRTQMPRRN